MGTLKVRNGTVWEPVGASPTNLPPGGANNALLAKQSAADGVVGWTTTPIVTSIYVSDGGALNTGVGAGIKIGSATTQKLGFWNATPVTQNAGWSVTGGYSADKAFNPESTTLTELARVLGTLIDALKAYGLLG